MKSGVEMMDEIGRAIQDVYSGFVLRDFLGKIMPGAVWWVSVMAALLSPKEFWGIVTSFNLWGAIFLTGLSWITGFLFQSRGEASGNIEYFVFSEETGIKDKDEWYSIYLKLRQHSGPLVREHERFVHIMEACGIMASALRSVRILVPLLWLSKIGAVHFAKWGWSLTEFRLEVIGAVVVVFIVVVLGVAVRGLQRFHEEHRKRQTILAKQAVELIK
jgi:hypothetical protein